ncbi:unnamed protein product [Prunus armeniaca]
MTEVGGPSVFTDVESNWTSEEEEQTSSESDEDLDEDPDFVDLAYAQSEEDVRLLRDDDNQFQGYVDHDAIDRDPNAGEEDEESDNNPASPRMCTLEHSSSESEVVTGNCLRKRKLPNFKDFIPSIDMKNPQFELGLRFPTREIFRAVVRRHSVLIGRELKFKGNANMHANAKYFSNWNESSLTNSNWDMGSFQEKVNQETGYYPSRAQAYRARSLATSNIEGSYTKQYELLWDYCEELKRTNPDNSVAVKSELEGSIGLDGCHIKDPHPGQLLCAVGVDANNGMFPLAYAIAKVESFNTWKWFLELLSHDLKIENSHSYLFMTDKQKGLIDAMDDLFPNAEHRCCLKHLYANFLKEHKGLALKLQMESIARATTLPWFVEEMKKMLELDTAGHAWLCEKDASQWARSHFRTDFKCDILMNNLSEAFNSSILPARNKPVLITLERIRIPDFGCFSETPMYLMILMASRGVAMDKWHGQVGPRIQGVLEVNKAAGAWDLSGLPCLHACAAVSRFHGNPEDYVHDFYKKDAYLRTYRDMIQPLPSQDLWPKSGLLPLKPPLYHKQPGRPKKSRKKALDKPKKKSNPNKLQRYHTVIKCSNCGQEGHNRTKCKEPMKNQPRRKQSVRRANTLGQSVQPHSQPRHKLHVRRARSNCHSMEPNAQPSQSTHLSQPSQSTHLSQPSQSSRAQSQSLHARIISDKEGGPSKKRLTSAANNKEWLKKVRATMQPWQW